MGKAQLCTSLGVGQPWLVPMELHQELHTLCSLQEQDKRFLTAFSNNHPPATKANAIK